MELTRIFREGNSAVLTPKVLPADETEYIFSHTATAREILDGLAESWDDCIPEADAWASMRKGLTMFTDDFLANGIEDLPPQERDF